MVVAADTTSQHAVTQALATIENCEIVLMLLNKARQATSARTMATTGMTPAADRAPVRAARGETLRLTFRRPAGCAATLLAGGALALATRARGAVDRARRTRCRYPALRARSRARPAPLRSSPVAPTSSSRRSPSRRRSPATSNFDRVRSDSAARSRHPDHAGIPRDRIRAAHSSLVGTITLPMLLYARTGGENNRCMPDVDLLGTIEAIDEHFCRSKAASTSTAAVPDPVRRAAASAVSNTLERYTSPTIASVRAFTRRAAEPACATSVARQQHLDHVSTARPANARQRRTPTSSRPRCRRDPAPFGGARRLHAHARQLHRRPAPALVERDRAPARRSTRSIRSCGCRRASATRTTTTRSPVLADAIYGVGVKWRPSERTSLDATGSIASSARRTSSRSTHRTPLTVWSLQASRDVTTYPQQLASLRRGTDVATLPQSAVLEPRSRTRCARQQAVDAVDPRLAGCRPRCTARSTSTRSRSRLVSDTRGDRRLRRRAQHGVSSRVYRNRNQPIVQAGDRPAWRCAFNDVTQTGGSVIVVARPDCRRS